MKKYVISSRNPSKNSQFLFFYLKKTKCEVKKVENFISTQKRRLNYLIVFNSKKV